MDKKKVKELIQEVIRNNIDSLEFGSDKHNAPLRKANGLLHDALIELGKSDWVSVEDGFPPIGETVRVRSKQHPNDFMLASRINKDTMKIVYPTNRYYSQDIIHWKPIEKLEE